MGPRLKADDTSAAGAQASSPMRWIGLPALGLPLRSPPPPLGGALRLRAGGGALHENTN